MINGRIARFATEPAWQSIWYHAVQARVRRVLFGGDIVGAVFHICAIRARLVFPSSGILQPTETKHLKGEYVVSFVE
jgi:hypothetical protein